MEKKLFSLPKLSQCGTYVYFQYWNHKKWQYERFKKHLSRKIPPEDLKAEQNKLLEYWTTELKNGYNPYIEKQKQEELLSYNYISKAVQDVCDERTEFLRDKSKGTYQSKVTIFKEWILQNKMTKMLANEFTQTNGEDFLRHLMKDRNASETTRNTYLVTMRTLFMTMQKKGIVKDNIWSEIPKIKEERLGKLPFKNHQKLNLKKHMQEKDPEMWLFVQFMYYCFIRPGELRQLTIGAIDLDEETILIDSKISKNKKSEYVTIPPPFLKYLREIKITSYYHKHYIFSPGGSPDKEMYSKDVFNRRHKKITDGFGYNRRYTLYSWKHTGAVDAINAGVKIKELQLQLRHADLQTTDIYLKSIGINDLNDLRNKFPEL